MKFDVRFLHGSPDAFVAGLHMATEGEGGTNTIDESPFAFMTMHLVSPTQADASVVFLREEHTAAETLNEVLLQINGVMAARGKRSVRHAELFVHGAAAPAPERPIEGLSVLASVSTPTSYRLWLREAATPAMSEPPVVAMVDVLLTNEFMATLVVVPFDARLHAEPALRSLIPWLIDAVPFLASRKNTMQELAIKAHPARYLGGADIKLKDEPAPGQLPDKWPGM